MSAFDYVVVYVLTFYFAATAELPFYMHKSAFVAEVAAMPRDHGPRFRLWELSGWMGITTCLIYDESDEVEKKPRSGAWIARTGWNALPAGAKPAGGHFYIITTDDC